MKSFSHKNYKDILILLLLLCICYLLIYKTKYEGITDLKYVFSFFNTTSPNVLFQTNTNNTTTAGFSTTMTTLVTTTTTTTTLVTTIIITTTAKVTTTTTVSQTTSVSTATTIDPAVILVERPPSLEQLKSTISNLSLAVFVFHTRHAVLTDLQVYLIKRLCTNLVGVEIYLDAPASEAMRQVAEKHKAGLYTLPEKLRTDLSSSQRNADCVNWAIATKGKSYLKNGSAILLLDGDVLPLSFFNADTLLSSRDLVCRKHPATYSRFCWIGFICLSPRTYNTIHDFNVSVVTRRGAWHDAGGQTIEYFIKYPNASFSWMKETILLRNKSELFWGAVDVDITWINRNFNPCDKCGPEIFFPPFNMSNAIFYHMVSGTSEWRFGDQVSRRQALFDSIMKSPYAISEKFSLSELTASVRKVQDMRLIPFLGNLTCQRICKGEMPR